MPLNSLHFGDKLPRRMKLFILIGVLIASCAGCTTVSLNRNVLDQSATLSDLRYREVVENLAAIAESPTTIPAFSSIWAGTTDINDSVLVNSQTTWVRTLASGTHFATENLDIPLKRNIKQNWSLNPILVPEKLRAMRCCCSWVLFGPQNLCGECSALRKYNSTLDCPGYYFDVMNELAAIPPGWFHVDTCSAHVPKTACYRAKRHGVCVWITPDGMHGLSDFTLVLQNIARADLASLYQPISQTREVALANGNINGVDFQSITMFLDQDGLLAPGKDLSIWPMKARKDNLGQDAALHSIITASKSP